MIKVFLATMVWWSGEGVHLIESTVFNTREECTAHIEYNPRGLVTQVVQDINGKDIRVYQDTQLGDAFLMTCQAVFTN